MSPSACTARPLTAVSAHLQTAFSVAAPDTPALLKVSFKDGLPVRVQNSADSVGMYAAAAESPLNYGGETDEIFPSLHHTIWCADISDPLAIYLYLNKVGGAHGVGRVDVVENRFVGIKSRGVYESPGAEILRTAHIGLEGTSW
jgi:argininosuccinate synthase